MKKMTMYEEIFLTVRLITTQCNLHVFDFGVNGCSRFLISWLDLCALILEHLT